MADRSPAPEPSGRDRKDAVPDDAAELAAPDEPGQADDEPTQSRSLIDRWWWQSFTVAVIGAVVIAFQWEVIGKGEGMAANWAMVVLGAAAIVFGGYLFWIDRRKQQSGAPTPDQQGRDED